MLLDSAKINFTENLWNKNHWFVQCEVLTSIWRKFALFSDYFTFLGTSDDDVAEEAINENVETVENFKNKGNFYWKSNSFEILTTFEFSCQNQDTKLPKMAFFSLTKI